jgi:hypothetical protein
MLAVAPAPEVALLHRHTLPIRQITGQPSYRSIYRRRFNRQ